MSLSSRLKARKLPEETVAAGGETFLVRGLTRKDKSQAYRDATEGEKLDFDKLETLMLERCVLDPETGEVVLTADEWACLDACIVGPLIDHIMRLNGMNRQEVKKAGKD